ncbi:HTH-type transcriptional regulator YesS [compost metagenome]
MKLETLADLFNYNSSYLGKLFKTHTGDHFNTYLDKVRIEKAKELLAQGLKVHQVAEKVGYGSVDYFHTKLKEYEGRSPSAVYGGKS